LSASHVAYGLRLTANLPIPGLPIRPNTQQTDVRVWLGEPSRYPISTSGSLEFVYVSSDEAEQHTPCLRVAVDPSRNYFAFFYRDGARFAVECHGREVWADWPQGYSLEDACTYLLGPVLGFVLRLRGIHCLHASAVLVGESAIALAGPPGAGKSTLAAAFGRSGFPVLSDDVVALADQGEGFLVQPGYPRVNLWPDSVRALFGFETALPRITNTWNKHYLPLDENGCRFASQLSLLHAVYILYERDPDMTEPVIEDVASSEALMALVTHSYVNYLLDRHMRSSEFALVARLVKSVPVRGVRPTGNPAHINRLCAAIANDAMALPASEKSLSTFKFG
jgi:hypothetical protein